MKKTELQELWEVVNACAVNVCYDREPTATLARLEAVNIMIDNAEISMTDWHDLKEAVSYLIAESYSNQRKGK